MGNKVLIFVTGVLAGAVLGGGLVYYSVHGAVEGADIAHVPSSKMLSGTRNNTDAETVKNPEVKETENLSTEAEKPAKKTDIFAAEKEIKKTVKDTLEKDTVAIVIEPEEEIEEEIIIVKKDELLISKIAKLIDLDPKVENTVKDSLVQLMSGVKEQVLASGVVVEYWKSPINYRGYKMNQQKVVLFGLQPFENPILYKWKDTLYLRTSDRIYRIEKNPEFKGYEPIIDTTIIRQLLR